MVQETDARLAERTAKHVARGGRVCLRVHGVSMLPWVRPRDIVVVRGTQLEAIRCGDLVLFARHGRLFVHRVVEKRDLAWNSHLLAKGDSHPKPDDPIQQFYQNNLVVALKPHLGTEPRLFYAGIDKEVR